MTRDEPKLLPCPYSTEEDEHTRLEFITLTRRLSKQKEKHLKWNAIGDTPKGIWGYALLAVNTLSTKYVRDEQIPF